MATEAQEKCVSAGMALFREYSSFARATPVIFPVNLKGLVRTEDMKIPHSELALHVGAAGKDIIAFALVGRTSALVAYDDGKGGCDFTFGGQHELFQNPLLDKVQEIWEKRGPE